MDSQSDRWLSLGGPRNGRLSAGIFKGMGMVAEPLTVKVLLASFCSGLVVFSVPAYLLLDRSAAVETVVHLEPDHVTPGQMVEVVWSVKVLRAGCMGLVHRQVVDSQNRIFAFASVGAVIHGKVGTTDTYRYDWTIPMGMQPGLAVFRRNTERWCNPLQHYFWPMQEVHEATFTVE